MLMELIIKRIYEFLLHFFSGTNVLLRGMEENTWNYFHIIFERSVSLYKY